MTGIGSGLGAWNGLSSSIVIWQDDLDQLQAEYEDVIRQSKEAYELKYDKKEFQGNHDAQQAFGISQSSSKDSSVVRINM